MKWNLLATTESIGMRVAAGTKENGIDFPDRAKATLICAPEMSTKGILRKDTEVVTGL